MNRIKQKILLFILFLFSLYCALIIGRSWDEGTHFIQGKITLDYLFSFGQIDKDFIYRENYSSIYWSLQYLLTTIFPSKYQFEIGHIINLIFSLSAIVGFSKINEILFNKQVGKIVFLILFFFPVFFGHMAFNGSDTILAFCHVWIIYLVLKYLKKQNIKKKANNYIISISLLAALATGIQLVFLGSLLAFTIVILVEIFFLKKFICKNFNMKKFYLDLIKSFLIFYFVLVLFWIDAHPNILTLPFTFLMDTLSPSYWTGWPYNMLDGNYFTSSEVPKTYLLINLFFKTPEYILVSYLFFLFLIISAKKFFKERFNYFNYKIFAIVLILTFPNIIFFLVPYAIYDGIRLFLWTIPFFCIIPALTFYYLIENFNTLKSKISLLFFSLLIFYFLFNFFTLTPYQYTYLNILTGENKYKYKKFENDYWGSSIKELIKNSVFKKNETILVATCGVSPEITKKYFQNKNLLNFKFVNDSEAEYIIMTNRTVMNDSTNQITNCFDKFAGSDVFVVERNNLVLSTIRKIN